MTLWPTACSGAATRWFASVSYTHLLGVLDGLVDVFLAHVGGSGDGNALLLAGTQILGADMHDAVGVDVEGDFDLRHTAGRRGDAVPVEGAQALVVLGELALALQNVDFDAGLVIRRRGEDLALLGGDGGCLLYTSRCV